MNKDEINDAIADNIVKGNLKVVGFKNNEESFSLTEKGISEAKKILAENPEQCLFLLNYALNSSGKEAFYKTIEMIYNIWKKIEVQK